MVYGQCTQVSDTCRAVEECWKLRSSNGLAQDGVGVPLESPAPRMRDGAGLERVGPNVAIRNGPQCGSMALVSKGGAMAGCWGNEKVSREVVKDIVDTEVWIEPIRDRERVGCVHWVRSEVSVGGVSFLHESRLPVFVGRYVSGSGGGVGGENG